MISDSRYAQKLPITLLTAAVILLGTTVVLQSQDASDIQSGISTTPNMGPPVRTTRIKHAYEYMTIVAQPDGRIEALPAGERTVIKTPVAPSPAQAKSQIPKPRGYTFQTTRTQNNLLLVLDLLGREGWEAVASSSGGGQPQWLLKRRIDS